MLFLTQNSLKMTITHSLGVVYFKSEAIIFDLIIDEPEIRLRVANTSLGQASKNSA